MFCALIKGHLETLHYFSSLCFGSNCAKMCIKNVGRRGGKGKCLFSGDCVKLMTVHTFY